MLLDLLKEHTQWDWFESCQEAFKNLNRIVTIALVLALLDITKLFEIQTDAPNCALGCVLLQIEHPVVYESNNLNYIETNYLSSEKELLGIIHYLQIWRHYPLGSLVTIQTDITTSPHFLPKEVLTHK